MSIPDAAFPIVAGRLCLDFVNTGVVRGEARTDRLGSYHDLVDWARRAGALDGDEAEYVLERWSSGQDGDSALETGRALRAQLRGIADRLVAGDQRIVPEAIEVINQVLRSRPGYLQLEARGADWAARWKVPLRRADDVLWRVARSAASLLTDDDLSLVRRCDRESCRLFFYDTTKNHRKRFCRMEVCGVAERSAAYYRRKSSASETPD